MDAVATPPTAAAVVMIPIDGLRDSPFNPRRTFGDAGLAELAADVRAQGILQPLRVRPTQDDAVHEVVFGHRRLRAARLAGFDDVPCIVVPMDDQQARLAQIGENLAREDVHPIEEAEGFAALMREHGRSAEDLVEQTGKSRSYVYGRLRLLQASAEVRDACLRGEFGAEIMLLIARLGSDKRQADALKAIAKEWRIKDLGDGGRASFRAVRDFLAERYMLRLSAAIFDTEDATLVPEAGACGPCPKRSGNAPELEDIVKREGSGYKPDAAGPNVCTDPDCFAAKKAAHLKREAAAIEAKGRTVIAGAKARQAVGADGKAKGAYVALADVAKMIKEATAGKKGKAKAAEPAVDRAALKPHAVLVQNPRDGKVLEVVPRSALEQLGVKVAAPAKHSKSWQQEEAERKAAFEAKAPGVLAFRRALFAACMREMQLRPRSADEFRFVLTHGACIHDWSVAKPLAEIFGTEPLAAKLIASLPDLAIDKLASMAIAAQVVEELEVDRYSVDRKPERLLEWAALYGIDVDAVRKAATAAPADTKSGELAFSADSQTESEDVAEATP